VSIGNVILYAVINWKNDCHHR